MKRSDILSFILVWGEGWMVDLSLSFLEGVTSVVSIVWFAEDCCDRGL